MNSTSFNNHLTYQVIGILYSVHNQLGSLHQKKHYQRAIAQVLRTENIPFEQEKPVDILFNSKKIGQYKLDFLINNQFILETKTINTNLPRYHYQILSYMNQLQVRIGLLVNFRAQKLQIKRLLLPDHYLI